METVTFRVRKYCSQGGEGAKRLISEEEMEQQTRVFYLILGNVAK